MTAPTIEEMDRRLLLDDRDLAAERDLDDEGRLARWRKRYPEPGFFEWGARRAWREAFAALGALPVRRTRLDAVLFPVWLCPQMEDSVNDEWEPTNILVAADGVQQRVSGPLGDRAVAVRIERVRRGFLAPARSSAPDIPSALRNERFVVMENESVDRVLAVLGWADAPGLPRPTAEMPPWTDGAEPAIDLAALHDLWARLTPPRASDT